MKEDVSMTQLRRTTTARESAGRRALLAGVALAGLLLAAPAAAQAQPGAWHPADPNDAHVQALAQFGVDNGSQAAHRRMALDTVAEASTQVVAGTNYRLTVTVNAEDPAETDLCTMLIWEKQWENFRQLLEFHCTPVS
ncbi:hypothetical protein IU494_30305 [Nocardia terpenica]|uniref:cystatin domain-containing protein n=1 Tax=Nocardia terpenica TaxID=455432 RepID=UPI001894E308|nr:cystatin domain-containing protein [Nocardia terpenica]MBF6064941.1 hypothetical protein [Nocardia terpenica]MBF6115213.1 hypothetical protein [Nocardia terpenica]MBF6122535.1 hypothetical protein [Nocardia terpenica]